MFPSYCVSADSIDALARAKARQRQPEFRAHTPPQYDVILARLLADEPAFPHRETWAMFKPRHIHAPSHDLHVMHFRGIASGLNGLVYARYECESCQHTRHVARGAITGEQMTVWEGVEKR